MKLQLLTIFSILFLTLLVSNCKSDEDPKAMDSKAFSVQEADTSSTFSIEQLKNDPAFVGLVRSQKLDDILKEKTSLVTLDKYKFKIDLKNITRFTSEKYTSYTFNIDRGKDRKGLSENLVLDIKNEEGRAYIISYEPEVSWVLSYLSGKMPEFKGKIYVEYLNSGDLSNIRASYFCEIVDIIIIYFPCPSNNSRVSSWNCEGKQVTITIEECNFSGGGIIYHYPSGGDGGGGGGGATTTLTGLNAQNMAVNIVKDFLDIPPYDPNAPAFIDWLSERPEEAAQILAYLNENNFSNESKSFALWAFNYINVNLHVNWNDLMYNRTNYDTNTGDYDNNATGGYDTNTYSTFNYQTETWPTISPVLSTSQFVGWDRNLSTNCMYYAKAQIAKEGWGISNYGDAGQTFQIFTSSGGINTTKLQEGMSYLKYALSNGIPVIVGVDNVVGSSNPNTDGTTDHFIVIVGMGEDSGGKYFRFYDNATSVITDGTHADNKLYFNPATNKITGLSKAGGANTSPNYAYSITQIRKSKYN